MSPLGCIAVYETWVFHGRRLTMCSESIYKLILIMKAFIQRSRVKFLFASRKKDKILCILFVCLSLFLFLFLSLSLSHCMENVN